MIEHGSTECVSFPAHSLTGAPTTQTGLLHRPGTSPPAGGWPFVTYGHMTTGGGDRSAPSTASPDHPEWRRISQGDALCDALLARGIAVLRPDYEGIGSPGPHPYLVPDSLAGSVRAMVDARHTFTDGLGDRWLSAGHSEGAIAALAAVRTTSPGRPVPTVSADLRGVAAFAPVTRMDLTIDVARRVPVRFPGSGVVSALIGLMLCGSACVDPEMAGLVAGDGLDERARRRWPQLAELCLTELAGPESWGGLPPAAIGGPRGTELFAGLGRFFRAHEVADFPLPAVPVRIDLGRVDEVAPVWLGRRLVQTYRRRGVQVTARSWPTHHSGVMRSRYAPSEAVDWIVARLGGSARDG